MGLKNYNKLDISIDALLRSSILILLIKWNNSFRVAMEIYFHFDWLGLFFYCRHGWIRLIEGRDRSK